jgi:hypothetical protein
MIIEEEGRIQNSEFRINKLGVPPNFKFGVVFHRLFIRSRREYPTKL